MYPVVTLSGPLNVSCGVRQNINYLSLVEDWEEPALVYAGASMGTLQGVKICEDADISLLLE